jgi:hypothetical protein
LHRLFAVEQNSPISRIAMRSRHVARPAIVSACKKADHLRMKPHTSSQITG